MSVDSNSRKWPGRDLLDRLLLRLWPERWLRSALLDAQSLGQLGEAVAARHLTRQGLTLLARRRRIAGVEVDLVARLGRRLVLVEVKCSAQACAARLEELEFPPGQRFNWERLERLQRVVRTLSQKSSVLPPRIDLVEVLVAGPDRQLELRWHPDRREAWPLPRLGRQGRTH